MSENMFLKHTNILGFSKGKWSIWQAELEEKEEDKYSGGVGGGCWLTPAEEIFPVAEPQALASCWLPPKTNRSCIHIVSASKQNECLDLSHLAGWEYIIISPLIAIVHVSVD